MTTNEDLFWALTEGADAIEHNGSFTIDDLVRDGHCPEGLPAKLREAAEIIRAKAAPHPEDRIGSSARLGPANDFLQASYENFGDMPLVNARTSKPTIRFELKYVNDVLSMGVHTS